VIHLLLALARAITVGQPGEIGLFKTAPLELYTGVIGM